MKLGVILAFRSLEGHCTMEWDPCLNSGWARLVGTLYS